MPQHEEQAAEKLPKSKIKPASSPVSSLSTKHFKPAGLQKQTDRNELEDIGIDYDYE